MMASTTHSSSSSTPASSSSSSSLSTLSFPPNFHWGSSTAAAQVETCENTPFSGLVARDGSIFYRTTDHEFRRVEDSGYICRFGNLYRCGVNWARLQPAPFVPFDPLVVKEYQDFFQRLSDRGKRLVFVFHHFAHPNWFEEQGGWLRSESIPAFMNFVQQCATHFGSFAMFFNTFNEPNVFAMNSYLMGNFPPRRTGRIDLAWKCLSVMGEAHRQAYAYLKKTFPSAQVGISFNTAYFEGSNWIGSLLATLVDHWFLNLCATPFELCDFWGLSYYAYLLCTPMPLDALEHVAELKERGLPHDDMWALSHEAFYRILMRFHQKYRKPILITENGFCGGDAGRRMRYIQDSLITCHRAIQSGVNLLGYVHWAAWDNFEWHLGPGFRFGLVQVNFQSMNRTMTEAGVYYEKVTKENCIVVSKSQEEAVTKMPSYRLLLKDIIIKGLGILLLAFLFNAIASPFVRRMSTSINGGNE